MNIAAKSVGNAGHTRAFSVVRFVLFIVILSLSAHNTNATTYYVNAGNTAPVPPYTSWLTAATNIQDAITMTVNGDTVLVTNGVYAFGGAVMSGTLNNRIAVTNAITVESVNGPWATTILGGSTTNGNLAARCAWLTNGASLIGFTVTEGATTTSGDINGGGVWCASSNAYVQNCVIISNTAEQYGCGVYQGTLNSCLISGNDGIVIDGAVYDATLKNCSVVSNNAYGVVNPPAMTNCLIYYNKPQNYTFIRSAFSHCCTTPALTGTGNFTTAPSLFVDGVHLTTGSPCIGAGVYIGGETDIFGNTYLNPPSVGCAEWTSTSLVTTPQLKLTSNPIGFSIGNFAFSAIPPYSFSWLENGQPLADNGHFSGTQTTNLLATGVSLADAGNYQIVVSNAFGAVTSSVATLTIHAVNASGSNPVPPYSSWANAATNIQDAINIAAAGDIVLVTNGIYSSGGLALVSSLTNRVALNKALTVTSVNGYKTTIIQGAWDPIFTNGPGAVRCAWVGGGAVLYGFTLQNGATYATGDGYQYGPLESGGGVFCDNTNGLVLNCELTNNSAVYGGGAAYGTVNNSLIVGNMANYGGGALLTTLTNCTIVNNLAVVPYIGAYGGAGTYSAIVRNSIVVGNFDSAFPSMDDEDAPGSAGVANYAYSCSSGRPWSLPSNAGNTNADPVFIDLYHLSTLSPCYGAGIAAYSSGYDLDGQPWNNPPSMGCSEIVLSNLIGPLSVNCSALWTNMIVGNEYTDPHYDTFYGTIQGHAAFICWSFGDGTISSNLGNPWSHEWSNPGTYPVTFTAYNNDNPNGVSTTLVVNVQSPLPAQVQSAALLTNGFGFQFAGQMDAIYTIQYATNLTPPISWQTLWQSGYNTQSVIQVLDPSSTNAARYYRVLTQ